MIAQFVNDVIQAGPDELASVVTKAFQPDFRQHNPGAADGTNGLFEAIGTGGVTFVIKKLHKVLAEGNFVLSVTEGANFGRHAVFYDLFRIEDDKVAEHWDVIQDIPAEAVHENTMFNL